MRKLGYILFIAGFLWVSFVAVGANPLVRGMRIHHREKVSEQQSYSREEVERAYGEAASEVAHFAQSSLVGCLLIFVGCIILEKAGTRESVTGRPPVI
jgi:hypothetical protein